MVYVRMFCLDIKTPWFVMSGINFIRISFFVCVCVCEEFNYSSFPNRRVARNKRGGGKDEPLLISVVPGISVMVGTFRSVTVIKRRTK